MVKKIKCTLFIDVNESSEYSVVLCPAVCLQLENIVVFIFKIGCEYVFTDIFGYFFHGPESATGKFLWIWLYVFFCQYSLICVYHFFFNVALIDVSVYKFAFTFDNAKFFINFSF